MFFQESDRMTKKSIISCWLRTRYAVVFDMQDLSFLHTQWMYLQGSFNNSGHPVFL